MRIPEHVYNSEKSYTVYVSIAPKSYFVAILAIWCLGYVVSHETFARLEIRV